MELKDEIVEILNDKPTMGAGQKIGSTIRTPILNPIINSPKVPNVIEINANIFDVRKDKE